MFGKQAGSGLSEAHAQLVVSSHLTADDGANNLGRITTVNAAPRVKLNVPDCVALKLALGYAAMNQTCNNACENRWMVCRVQWNMIISSLPVPQSGIRISFE